MISELQELPNRDSNVILNRYVFLY